MRRKWSYITKTSWQCPPLSSYRIISLHHLFRWKLSSAFHLAHSGWQIQFPFYFWKIAYWRLSTWIRILYILRIKINFHFLIFYNMRFLLPFLKNLTFYGEFFFQYNCFSGTDLKDFDKDFVTFFIKLYKIPIKFSNIVFNFFLFCSIFRLVFGLHFD